jgi:SAM-dependent methyltransferase
MRDSIQDFLGLQAVMERLSQLVARAESAANDLGNILLHLDSLRANYDAEREARVVDREAIIHRVNYTNHNLYLHLAEANRKRELFYRDIMIAIDHFAKVYPGQMADFTTETPVAVDTDDHNVPWGAAHDNTRLPRLVAACERRFQRPLTFLDLGCSGGGLVLDFVLRGHRAFGIEGSDHPLRALRAEWRVLHHSLMTGDITKPFYLNEKNSSEPVLCDVISMWEVLEHIATEDLPQLFSNIRRHLKKDGIFIGSVAHVPDDHPNGAKYHRTVQPAEWWTSRFSQLGMRMIENHGFVFEDFARGTNNGPIDENYKDQAGIGTHFVAVQAD